MTENTRWVYGTDHDAPDPYTLQPGHTYVELVGGPLDGQLLDVTACTPEERADGALLMSDHGVYGPGGRADYEPRSGCATRWDWRGDVPW
ncbi:hypothetical protein ACN24M_39455 [Streptomyces microflavus]|uniref:hypothetical protein n=1 Tax=Streptomyces microflavus TaxID=1919 RepID=UPI003B21B212